MFNVINMNLNNFSLPNDYRVSFPGLNLILPFSRVETIRFLRNEIGAIRDDVWTTETNFESTRRSADAPRHKIARDSLAIIMLFFTGTVTHLRVFNSLRSVFGRARGNYFRARTIGLYQPTVTRRTSEFDRLYLSLDDTHLSNLLSLSVFFFFFFNRMFVHRRKITRDWFIRINRCSLIASMMNRVSHRH